jgi:hypothetical protein
VVAAKEKIVMFRAATIDTLVEHKETLAKVGQFSQKGTAVLVVVRPHPMTGVPHINQKGKKSKMKNMYVLSVISILTLTAASALAGTRESYAGASCHFTSGTDPGVDAYDGTKLINVAPYSQMAICPVANRYVTSTSQTIGLITKGEPGGAAVCTSTYWGTQSCWVPTSVPLSGDDVWHTYFVGTFDQYSTIEIHAWIPSGGAVYAAYTYSN